MLSVNQPLEHNTIPVHVLAKETREYSEHSIDRSDTLKNKHLSDLVRYHLKLIKEITTRFSEAVNEQFTMANCLEDEDEKSILLSLSNEIAAAKNKNDLFRVASSKLNTLFSVSGFVIALLSEEGKNYSAFIFDAGKSLRNHPAFNDIMLMSYRADDELFKNVVSATEPVILELSAINEVTIEKGYLHLWKASGIIKVIGVALRAGEKNLGCLFLPISNNLFDNLSIDILKGVCAQLSLAVSNMMSIEEIAERENERRLLLSLNSDIATARNNKELEQIIKLKLKNLLGCSHTLIATINDDQLTASAFLLDPEAKTKGHPDYQNAKHSRYPINDGVLNKATLTSLPLIFDLTELSEQDEMPLYARINFESGLRQLVITRFSKGNEVFGFWMLYFEDRQNIRSQKLDLIQSLSNQISIAVANILANQDIQNRKNEKARLLKFSNAIASVRDKVVLSKILTQQLDELFGIKSYSIHGLNEDRSKQMLLFFDPEGIDTVHPDFTQLLNSWTDINDGVFNVILESDGPVLLDMNKWLNQPDLQIYANALKGFAARSMIGIPIQLGSENIAVMYFTHDDYKKIKDQEYLLKTICSQIAIAVSNIIANEKVNRQLCEINSYKQRLEDETVYLKEEIEINQNYAEIIGESLPVQKVFRLVTQVAPSDSTVLILGETGTGKELVARAIHNNSRRKNKLMVKVNCAALPANLIESELFGHERGSFTGATERRLGKFELANNGTLFLDEIGEMPLELQVKLLRAIQEKEIERVGGKGVIKVDVRIIAATNRDLELEMEEGRFRSDLFYRLNIFPIYLASLRERREDIPMLATHFIHRYSKKVGRKITTLSNKVMQDLMQYNWPGNIRELEHLIERSVLLTTGDTIKQIHLPSNKTSIPVIVNESEVLLCTIDENERDHILKILKYCKGRISGPGGAGDILGVPASTLNSKIKRLGIRKEHLV